MKLSNIINEFISGDWENEEFSEETPNEVYCIRGADIIEEEFNSRMALYKSELTEQFEKSHRLEEEIMKQLDRINFNV